MSDPLFDKSSEYDAMLAAGLKLSGESKDFFMRGRTADLKAQLPAGFSPKNILDYGCGLGETSHYLALLFPQAKVTGTDTAVNALNYAENEFRSDKVSFAGIEHIQTRSPYDLVYTNGVFHHIEPANRAKTVSQIYQALQPGGYFALFENNPWNPGTRMVMKRIAFDRDAKMLSFGETWKMLQAAGFQCTKTRFLFYFPRALKVLRFLEPLGASIPLGAQYYVLAKKN